MNAGWIFADRAEAGRRLAAAVTERDISARSFSCCRAAAFRSGSSSRRRLVRRSTCCWCARSAFPTIPELAAGAIVDGEDPQLVLNDEVVALSGMSQDDIEAARQRALTEIARRRERYLAGRPPVDVSGCTAIVVDDGIATGATARAGFRSLRNRGAAGIVLAVPVAPSDTIDDLAPELDDVCAWPLPSRSLLSAPTTATSSRFPTRR